MGDTIAEKFAEVRLHNKRAKPDVDQVREHLAYVERLRKAGVWSHPKFGVAGPLDPRPMISNLRCNAQS